MSDRINCDQCGGPLPVVENQRGGRPRRFCSAWCLYTWHNRRKAAEKTAVNLAERKPCRRCGAEISASKRSHAVYCSRACMTLDVRARNYDGKKARDYNRRYLYGLSTEEFDALLASQGGGCAICGTTEWPGKGNRPHLDHDHVTRRPRGVLCDGCNNGLGRFADDPVRLRAAAAYLEAHQT